MSGKVAKIFFLNQTIPTIAGINKKKKRKIIIQSKIRSQLVFFLLERFVLLQSLISLKVDLLFFGIIIN
jgi:hypothetical protein